MKIASMKRHVISRPFHLFDEIRLNNLITEQISAPSRRKALHVTSSLYNHITSLEPFLLKSEKDIEKEMVKIFQKTGDFV